MLRLQRHIFQIVLAGILVSTGLGLNESARRSLPYQSKQPSTRKIAQFPFELHGNMTFVAVRVNGSKPLSFGLDTGAYLSVINTPIVEQIGLKTGGRDSRGSGSCGDGSGRD